MNEISAKRSGVRYNVRMPMARPSRVAASLLACALLGACGSGAEGSSAPAAPTATAPASAIPGPAHSDGATLLDWPEFGLDPQRSDSSDASTGIDAANLAHLRRVTVSLPGTVDSSPIYLHDANVRGATRPVAILTTTYGKTLALDPGSGRILWTYTPPGYDTWAGRAQITNSSPVADPDGRFVYAASPDGLIHKLALGGGTEVRAESWPASVTRDATHEKLGSALNLSGSAVIVTTSGYIGDAPPYQGHVVLIDRASGRVTSVFNTLCANRRRLMVPRSCPSSDSAILSRGGAVVEPGGRRLLISTGNARWNGSGDFGDSVIELTLPQLRARQAYTPTNQAELNSSDSDLGSSAPALLSSDRAMIAGKDGLIRVLSLSRLDGHSPSLPNRLGGEVQRLPLPGGGMLFTTPAVWRRQGHTTVFIGDEHATAAYALRAGRLRLVWQSEHPGTSPVLAGGLLYVYDPADGGVYVYSPRSGKPLSRLPGAPGHWNSPIVAGGHVLEPEGDANDHRLSGSLDLFSTRPL